MGVKECFNQYLISHYLLWKTLLIKSNKGLIWLHFRFDYKIGHILFCPVLFTLPIVDFQDKIELAIPLSPSFILSDTAPGKPRP